jgi:hypothetical protein
VVWLGCHTSRLRGTRPTSTESTGAGASLREFESGVFCFRSSAGLAQKANATGHFSVIFLKPLVVFESQNICVRSPTIQVEFEIERSSTATLSAVASASIASDRSRSDRDGEMR